MSLQDRVKEAVNWNTPSIDGENSLHQAISQMGKYDVSAFVVKMNGIVAGILGCVDLIESVITHQDLHAAKVADVMTSCQLVTEEGAVNPCAQIDEDESVENALKVLDSMGTHNLLVAGSTEREAGLVSLRDLLGLAIK